MGSGQSSTSKLDRPKQHVVYQIRVYGDPPLFHNTRKYKWKEEELTDFLESRKYDTLMKIRGSLSLTDPDLFSTNMHTMPRRKVDIKFNDLFTAEQQQMWVCRTSGYVWLIDGALS